MDLSDDDVMLFKIQLRFPALFDIACCKVVTVLWRNSLATYGATRNEHGELLNVIPEEITDGHIKWINELPDMPLALKDKLLALEERVAKNVNGVCLADYSMPEYSKLFFQFNYLAEIDLVGTSRVLFDHMKCNGCSDRSRFKIACATANQQLIDEVWEELTPAVREECGSTDPFFLPEYLGMTYFACERLGSLESLNVRTQRSGRSAVFYVFQKAILRGQTELIKHFMPLLSAHEQQFFLPEQLFQIVCNICYVHKFGERESRLFLDSHFASIIFILQNMNANHRESLVKDRASYIITCLWLSQRYNHLVLPLARKLYTHMTIDKYKLCLQYLRDNNEVIRTIPTGLEKTIDELELYFKLHPNLDICGIELLRGRPHEVLEVGSKLCAAWIDGEKWVDLDVFIAVLVPDEQYGAFVAKLHAVYYKELRTEDMDRKWEHTFSQPPIGVFNLSIGYWNHEWTTTSDLLTLRDRSTTYQNAGRLVSLITARRSACT